jgi:aminoglycoside phosphotransferase (APT) family kinase protein
MAAESRALPQLAPRLPLPVPHPIFIGRADGSFPWPFAGYRRLAGRTACAVALDDAERTALAGPLARFFAALHAVSRAEAAEWGLEPDSLDKLIVEKRRPRLLERLAVLAEKGLVADTTVLESIADETTDTPDEELVPAHGDVYSRHFLVDDQRRLCGVIDWGDIHLGNRAVDLAIAHSFLPSAAHAAFRAAYGPITDAAWRLARFRALDHSVAVTHYGHEIRDGDLLREGLTSLRYVGIGDEP